MLQLISLLSFFLPTQLGLHLNSIHSTVFGFSVDYLIPTIYLTDLIALLIILFGIKKLKLLKKYLKFGVILIVFMALNIFVSEYKLASLYKWLRVVEMLLLGLVILNTKKFDVFKNFLKPLSYSIFIVCFLGILQFVSKSSIGGIFYFLGERTFLFSDPNIAPYPYSTFSHSNSFAGFLLVFGILLLQFRKKFDSKYFLSLLVLVIVNLLLTNSLNVYMAIFVLFLLSLKKRFLFGFLSLDLGVRFTDFRFITHRIELIKSSLEMIKENFFLGVGLNNFIPRLVKVSNTFVNSWELQPVHNIFLLVLSETGIVGLLTFMLLVFKNLSVLNYPLIAILLTGINDHYWLTLQQNILLFVFIVVISERIKKEEIKI